MKSRRKGEEGRRAFTMRCEGKRRDGGKEEKRKERRKTEGKERSEWNGNGRRESGEGGWGRK